MPRTLALGTVGASVDRMEASVDRMEASVDRMEASLDRIDASLDRIDVSLDRTHRVLDNLKQSVHEAFEQQRRLDAEEMKAWLRKGWFWTADHRTNH